MINTVKTVNHSVATVMGAMKEALIEVSLPEATTYFYKN